MQEHSKYDCEIVSYLSKYGTPLGEQSLSKITLGDRPTFPHPLHALSPSLSKLPVTIPEDEISVLVGGRCYKVDLEGKFMTWSYCQDLGQLADLSSDWLLTLVCSRSGASLLVDTTLDNKYN